MAYDRVLNADDHYETEDEDGHDGEFEEVTESARACSYYSSK